FSPAYQSRTSPEEALLDIDIIRLLAGDSIEIRLRARGADAVGLRVYHLGSPIALSSRVPMLENFGFRVIEELTSTVTPAGLSEVYLHDMTLEPAPDMRLEPGDDTARLENAILAVWRGAAESDGLNRLRSEEHTSELQS